jgi:transcriptional regulator with XRE-family HTH domain
MANERLRVALLEQGLTPAKLAEQIGVDTKTIERWIGQDRKPYRKNRYKVAALLKSDEAYLWPGALSGEQVAEAGKSEVVLVYSHRWAVPREAWERLFSQAEQQIDVLVYSGLFLAEDSGLRKLLQRKARDGVHIRLALGDPDSEGVRQRGIDEGIGDEFPAKIRNGEAYFKGLMDVGGVEVRRHSTVLYNSFYRGDDQLFVNSHIYGAPATDAPVLHLRSVAGGDMVNMYLESFEKVWDSAIPM